ncbi:(Na+)-NQR maturation NqrM [Pseudomonas sp.]|uniref:(Na+)-NQR maturation NqrM n=1 Tax=Pseudomonas sp. TaxID=306 RepID=UPI002732A634|nr:(Na+)-NQR maturation NqrM [Pseudomonas sp.]MDP3814129.1 (Na+)-NQR maturation NqrM [Pseudomonas sp.]
MIGLMVFYSMLLVVPSMAVAVSMGRRPIAGSCAGFTNMGIEKQCSICGASREKGEEFNSGTAESSPKRLV